MSFSKTYTISVSFPVKYINLPSDKLVANALPEAIDIKISSSGFHLLLYKLKQHRETILIDINDTKPLPMKNNYFICCNERLDKITSQFNAAINIVSVFPDTIFVNYNKKVKKRVPIKKNIYINFEEQYQLKDSITVVPDFVDVSGTKEDLDKITYVETAQLKLNKIAGPAILKVELSKPKDLKQVEFSQNTVQVKFNVTKYTESVLELPIEVENLPHGLILKTFPDKVILKYQVAFDDYGKIMASDFRVAVDYLKIEAGSNKLKVQILKSPSLVRSVKLNNDKVEYIIRK